MAVLLGLGKVGKNLLLQYSNQNHSFTINLIADSKHILSKRNREAFSKIELQKIVAVKEKESPASHDNYEDVIKGSCIDKFDTVEQELSTIFDLTSASLRDWVMLDMSLSSAEADCQIARKLMGCIAYCTGNKALWADYELCSDLYDEARRGRTQLGLNCTTGVWVNQMEVLPIVALALKRGRVDIRKRDNSSFNSFFSKVGQGLDSGRAISEIAAAGHLEKTGADTLSAEVKDQTYKACIAANICGILRGRRPNFHHKMTLGPSGPESLSPADIAAWHLEGRKRGKYPALIGEIRMEDQELLCNIGFEELSKEDTLARDFPAKCAFSVRAHSDTRFLWSSTMPKSRMRRYTNSDYGGAVRTAAKLLWETERAISLSQESELEDDYSPLPILCALSAGRRDAKSLQTKLAKSLL
jgi:homoserine dehydrogenase